MHLTETITSTLKNSQSWSQKVDYGLITGYEEGSEIGGRGVNSISWPKCYANSSSILIFWFAIPSPSGPDSILPKKNLGTSSFHFTPADPSLKHGLEYKMYVVHEGWIKDMDKSVKGGLRWPLLRGACNRETKIHCTFLSGLTSYSNKKLKNITWHLYTVL